MTFATLARRTAGLLPALATAAAMAHPGHDTAPAMSTVDFLWHLLSQPDHLGVLVGGVVIAMIGARAWRASRSLRRR
jgi:hypothetical protein